MGIGARPGRRPGPGAMSDRGPTPCARGRCLPLIQPFSLVPALLSRAFNAALGKRQTRKKHHGICLPLVVSLPITFYLSLSLSFSLSISVSFRTVARVGDRRTSQGIRGDDRSHAPTIPSTHVGALFTLLLLSLFFTCIHVLLKPIAHLTALGNLTVRAAVSSNAHTQLKYTNVYSSLIKRRQNLVL